MNMKGTYLAAALIAVIGYLSIALADSRMGLDKEMIAARDQR